MGPQSQRRNSQAKRTHQMQANSKGYRKKNQYMLPEGTVFDPQQHCEVCKGRIYGRELHRAHHPLCWNNRRKKAPPKPPQQTTTMVAPQQQLNNPQQMVQPAPLLFAQPEPAVVFVPWNVSAAMPVMVPQQPLFCCTHYQEWYQRPSMWRRGRPPHHKNCNR